MKKLKRYLKNLSGVAALVALMLIPAVPLAHAPVAIAQSCTGDYVEQDGECVARSRNTCNSPGVAVDASNCPFIADYIIPAINVLSASVGLIVVSMVVWGAIRYIASRDNPQQTAEAKNHIQNALLGMVCYIFIIAFLNWVVPGGLF